jgi:glycosyltransferase 2 family protein
VLTNYLFCIAPGISIGYIQLLWVVAAVSLVQSLPISIAGVGVREGAYVYLLGLQGVAEPIALALSLLIFGTQILLALMGGLLQLKEVLETRRNGILPG